MTLKEAIAKRILELCEQRQITINKLSIMCGMTQSTLNNIINTGSKRPQVDTIKKDLTPGEILDGEGGFCAHGEFFSADSFKEVDEEFE